VEDGDGVGEEGKREGVAMVGIGGGGERVELHGGVGRLRG